MFQVVVFENARKFLPAERQLREIKHKWPFEQAMEHFHWRRYLLVNHKAAHTVFARLCYCPCLIIRVANAGNEGFTEVTGSAIDLVHEGRSGAAAMEIVRGTSEPAHLAAFELAVIPAGVKTRREPASYLKSSFNLRNGLSISTQDTLASK